MVIVSSHSTTMDCGCGKRMIASQSTFVVGIGCRNRTKFSFWSKMRMANIHSIYHLMPGIGFRTQNWIGIYGGAKNENPSKCEFHLAERRILLLWCMSYAAIRNKGVPCRMAGSAVNNEIRNKGYFLLLLILLLRFFCLIGKWTNFMYGFFNCEVVPFIWPLNFHWVRKHSQWLTGLFYFFNFSVSKRFKKWKKWRSHYEFLVHSFIVFIWFITS